uniref:Orn/DAP/Arg decarboxylase 2 N-terminal domain-containing protein n=1 Tax=Chromera velia CCMP2878 TaxID=1169474 RepID=A0A0G4HL69_9ALVE|eukprot:Cvel_28671.t1-p1 / transcript=Cvel_28671.t1 / gene=Cvel_28671 / organism=Chromera_velia_CCMP2878 / gene_product=Protein TabA, putative / transcript_product=Protein TabA, putative / location=Cvel_scaffold3799:32-5122(-) / protein_length=530 / sequence_SO=supercontig / SO=protein_coding / is_pseudo=false
MSKANSPSSMGSAKTGLEVSGTGSTAPTKSLLPFTEVQIRSACKTIPTPFHMYSELGLRTTCRRLNQAFNWTPGFMNYFAVKATPNPHLLKILQDEGFGADCSSLAELMLSEACGFEGPQIMFTSNNTTIGDFQKAKDLGAIINLDDISHIAYIDEKIGLPEFISLRYNPGSSRTGNVIIGHPEEAKFGLTREQLFEAYADLKKRGVKGFGLHAMVVSNCTDPAEIGETARMLFQLVLEVKEKSGVEISQVNLGGGIGVAYEPGTRPVDMQACGKEVKTAFSQFSKKSDGALPLRIVMECGRAITGPNGVLVSRCVHQKRTYKNYVGLDACMSNLMRPGMYGAYHHVTVLPVEDSELSSLPGASSLPSVRSLFDCPPSSPSGERESGAVGEEKKQKKSKGRRRDESHEDRVYDVVGGLCENNDKFAIDRQLNASPRIGDIVVVHDAGAHGHSMGFQYNGKIRSAEVLVKTRGELEMIRRAETYADYFATLDWQGLPRPGSSWWPLQLALAGAAGAAVAVGVSSYLRGSRS